VAIALVIVPLFALGGPVHAAQKVCFTEYGQSGYCLAEAFRQYRQGHGGLAQQGMPISGLFAAVSPLDGKTYTVQYFERTRFEYHPENAAPYNVLRGLVGGSNSRPRIPTWPPTAGISSVRAACPTR